MVKLVIEPRAEWSTGAGGQTGGDLVPEEPGAEPGTEVAVVEPRSNLPRRKPKTEKEMDRSPEPGPVVWWTKKDKTNGQIS